MAEITVTTQASVAVPSTNDATIYVDSVDKRLKVRDDSGAVTNYANAAASVTSLTGDVTGTGPGAAATSIASAVVTGKLLTGLPVLSGVVADTDTILAAIAKLSSRTNSSQFGNGADGIVTITTDTTLVRDMYYESLTVNVGAILSTAGFRIHVSNVMTVNGVIDRSGNLTSTNAGALGLIAGTTGLTGAGGAGGGVGVGVGGTATTNSIGANGGAGGAGASGAGAVGTALVPTALLGGAEVVNAVRYASVAQQNAGLILQGGGGGSGGGGSGVAGSAGGAGSGAGVIVLMAKSLVGTGTVRANGGGGANAPLANAGGGGGGGGGALLLITENDTLATSIVFQANGGLGGAGNGTGLSGNVGGTGRIVRLRA